MNLLEKVQLHFWSLRTPQQHLHDALDDVETLYKETDENLMFLGMVPAVQESKFFHTISIKRDEMEKAMQLFAPYKKGAAKGNISADHARDILQTLSSLTASLTKINQATLKILERYRAKN